VEQSIRQIQPMGQDQERAKELAKKVFDNYVQEQQQAQQE
jgi:hypothetical protein